MRPAAKWRRRLPLTGSGCAEAEPTLEIVDDDEDIGRASEPGNISARSAGT